MIPSTVTVKPLITQNALRAVFKNCLKTQTKLSTFQPQQGLFSKKKKRAVKKKNSQQTEIRGVSHLVGSP